MRILLLSLLSITLLLSACSDKKDNQAVKEIGYGETVNNQYTNTYLGLKIELPTKWHSLDRNSLQTLMNQGSAVAAGDNKNLQNVLKASELQTVPLVGVFKEPYGAPIEFNPNVLIIAEKLSNASGIKKGSDYHFHSKKLFEQSAIPVEFGEEYSKTINGIAFDVVPITMGMVGQTVFQEQWATIINDYAFIVIASKETPDSVEPEIEALIQSIQKL